MSLRDMTSHRLLPLRHFWEGNHLICNAVPDADQAALFTDGYIPAGRCMHLTRTTKSNEQAKAKLGCDGNAKIPVWLYRDSDSYSGGFLGDDPATSLQPTFDTGMDGQLLMFVGLEGFEMATTEFVGGADYIVGDYLAAPEHNPAHGAGSEVHARTIAGVVHNASLLFGRHTIIGQVSPGVFTPLGYDRATDGAATQAVHETRVEILTFYTCYRPPLQALPDGATVF